jgi:hypothetical protein
MPGVMQASTLNSAIFLVMMISDTPARIDPSRPFFSAAILTPC